MNLGRWGLVQREPDGRHRELRLHAWPTMAGGRSVHLAVGHRRLLLTVYSRATRRALMSR